MSTKDIPENHEPAPLLGLGSSEGLGVGAGVHGRGECGCPLCGGCGWNSPWRPCICYTPASTGETIAYTSGTGKQWLGGTVDGA